MPIAGPPNGWMREMMKQGAPTTVTCVHRRGLAFLHDVTNVDECESSVVTMVKFHDGPLWIDGESVGYALLCSVVG